MFRIITILFCWLVASFAVTSVYAQRTGDPVKDAELADRVASRKGNVLKIADGAPDRYVVKKGDTLWGISSTYLTDPWRWPELWRGNMEQVKDPHWIYPGDVLVLDRTTGTLSRQRGGVSESGISGSGVGVGGATVVSPTEVKLSPTLRAEQNVRPIPMVPANVVEPFLTRPLVIDASAADGKVQEADVLRNAPRIIGAPDDRYILSTGDRAYVQGLVGEAIDWDVFRPGGKLIDPDDGSVLGVEAIYLGSVRVLRRGEPAEIIIRSVKQEINRGDRLVAAEREPLINYTLRRPEADIKARLMSVYGGVGSGGQFSIITINKGKRDRLAAGNVMALFRELPPIEQTVDGQKEKVKIAVPDERIGLVAVFRVAERVSYAIVMEANRPIQVGDRLASP